MQECFRGVASAMKEQLPGSADTDSLTTVVGDKTVREVSLNSYGMAMLDEARGDDLAVPNVSHLKRIVSMGYRSIMELTAGLTSTCYQLMCNVVAGAPWEKVAAEAKHHADTADYMLETLLASQTTKRSVMIMDLLHCSVFSHLCQTNSDKALRWVRRSVEIIDRSPGIVRLPGGRHVFHWLTGLLEAADLHKLYDTLTSQLASLKIKRFGPIPPFEQGHTLICNCTYFECQAMHQALMRCAREDHYGSFSMPTQCHQSSGRCSEPWVGTSDVTALGQDLPGMELGLGVRVGTGWRLSQGATEEVTAGGMVLKDVLKGSSSIGGVEEEGIEVGKIGISDHDLEDLARVLENDSL
ncbi:unnamed protein product [Choristocarpus tenellus]